MNMRQSPSRTRWLVATLLATSGVTVMAGAILAPALPRIAAAFPDQPSSPFLVRLVLTMPALSIAIGAPAVGAFVDRWGRRRLLLIMLVLYAVAGGAGLLLDSLVAILVSRAVFGFAIAGIMTCSTTLIGDYFRGADRRRILGMQAAFMALGAVVCLPVGGALADVSWRAPFATYGVSLLILPMAVRWVPEPPPAVRSAAAAAHSPVRFPRAEVTIIYALAFIGWVTFYMVPVYLGFYLGQEYGAGGTGIGLAMACMTGFAALSAAQYPRLRRVFSEPAIVAGMFLMQGLGYVLLPGGTRGWLYAGLIVAGLGVGVLMPNLNVWLLARTPESVRGRVVGGLTTCVFLGQFLSPVLIGPLVHAVGIARSFVVTGCALAVVGAAFAGHCLRRRTGRADPESADRP